MNKKWFSYALLVFALTGCATAAEKTKWVGTWSSSVQEVEADLVPDGFSKPDDTTIRQQVHVSIGGDKIRIRISNAFAGRNETLQISAVNVALCKERDQIVKETLTPVTFFGETSVRVPSGLMFISDPIDFELPDGADVAVTMHVVNAPRTISGHRSARGEYVFLKKGNHVDAEAMPEAAVGKEWYYLGGMDVLSPETSSAIICLGDSITDGKGSTEGKNVRWPDLLAARLRDNPKTAELGMMNHGIGGNSLWSGGIGQTALQRLERDILSQPGTEWLIVMEGINDLGNGGRAADVIKSYQQIIARAHDCGMRVYGITVLPCGTSFYDRGAMEEERQKVNEWIRTSGAFDEVLDWDAVVRDPENPRNLLAVADSGDHLHLSDKGYEMLANSVDLKLFGK
ncbi:MAG: SGNH/GDSL hydrolase family protein [Pontiellaceae bacterium]|nr:SGNH/GDSL hydrolase family protein [Pontiellaceae bacterium]